MNLNQYILIITFQLSPENSYPLESMVAKSKSFGDGFLRHETSFVLNFGKLILTRKQTLEKRWSLNS